MAAERRLRYDSRVRWRKRRSKFSVGGAQGVGCARCAVSDCSPRRSKRRRRKSSLDRGLGADCGVEEPLRSGFMDSEREFLSGREAQVILSESFLRPAVREMVKEPDDYTVADRLGRHWYSALRRLEVLGHGESHKSVDGRPFAVDVQEAVCIYPCGSSGSCTAARGFGKRCGTSLRVHTNRPRRASNRRGMDIASG